MASEADPPHEVREQDREQDHEPKRFEPKQKVEINPPKDDPYTYEDLKQCDGMH